MCQYLISSSVCWLLSRCTAHTKISGDASSRREVYTLGSVYRGRPLAWQRQRCFAGTQSTTSSARAVLIAQAAGSTGITSV